MEGVGAAAAVLQLVDFALRSSLALRDAIISFRSHKKRVTDLTTEVEALHGALASLNDMASSQPSFDISALEVPLDRCGRACDEFRNELEKCAARSGGNKTSFRDWARMRYMGEDIDGFRRSLAAYKSTICIALTDATLRRASATAEGVEVYTNLVKEAQANLEDRLEVIDEKLDTLLKSRSKTEKQQKSDEIVQIREERLNTQRWLQICEELASHIDQIQNSLPGVTDVTDETLNPNAQHIAQQGLLECKLNMEQTAAKIRQYEQETINRLMTKLEKSASTVEDHADIVRLRDEWFAVLQNMDICTKALGYLDERGSTIDNYATGDAIQIMVSTNDKTINGKNRGLGWRTRQVGGHMSDESLRQIAQTLSSSTSDHGSTSWQDNESRPEDETLDSRSSFKGKGFVLQPDSLQARPGTADRHPTKLQ